MVFITYVTLCLGVVAILMVRLIIGGLRLFFYFTVFRKYNLEANGYRTLFFRGSWRQDINRIVGGDCDNQTKILVKVYNWSCVAQGYLLTILIVVFLIHIISTAI